MKRYLLIVFLHLFFICSAFSQNSKVKGTIYLAPFKNDAAGAYTLIHDDFGADWASGIGMFADTMAYRRGIPFSFAVIAGHCSAEEWKRANELIAHGHQVLNHSMSHVCGQHFEWCTAGNWDAKDFPLEIDKSTAMIETHTGHHPAFFIFPFDLFTDTMLTYLQHKNYAGARAGAQDVLQSANIKDPFRLNFKVFRPDHSPSELNAFANEAVQKKDWAIRVVHGVNDESWGMISLEDYANHLNYLRSMSDSNLIWISNLSDVLLYRYLRENYKADPKSDAKGRITGIDFKAEPASLKLNEQQSRTFSTSKLRTLTVVVVQPNLKVSKVMQQGKEISFKIMKDKILIEADPSAGPLTLSY